MKRFHWYMPNHWWENRFGPGEITPFDTFKRILKQWCYRFRIDLCFDESDGFDVGSFVFDWKRSRGPFMRHRQAATPAMGMCFDAATDVGPWRLMVALTPAAYRGFDEAVLK